jgi:hypothetical protein
VRKANWLRCDLIWMEIYIHLLDPTRNRSRKCNFRPLAGIEPAALRFWLEHCTGNAGPQVRLLARVLKEGVQFWYNNTSIVRGVGGGAGSSKRSSGNLWSLRYFISVSVPSSFEIFRTHLALWVCAAMLLYLSTTFSFSQLHHQIDQNIKCIIK